MKRYESAIRVVTAFFAVLLGFGLKRLLDSTSFSPPNALWPCFILSVLIFLRFLLGSSNHMWFEYVKPDLDQKLTFVAPRKKILADFLFLVAFGLIGVAICYSSDLDHFLKLNLVLTGVGLVWVVVYVSVVYFSSRNVTVNSSHSGGKWHYWSLINLIQFTSVLVVLCFFSDGNWPMPWWPTFMGQPWDISLLVLAVIYLVLLVFDLGKQLSILES